MAWKPDYVTATELKTYLRIGDTDDDALLAVAITAASRAVDHACNRQFGVLGAAAARYYRWDGEYIEDRQAVPIDDLQSTTNLAVAVDTDDNATWDTTIVNATDFDLWPWNATEDGRPWTHLILRDGTALGSLYRTARSLRVTALFGWTAVPKLVVEATQLQAARFFSRRNATFGIAGSPDVGSELRLLERLDPDVAVALRPVRRASWGAVI